jgi:hypothetical protein
MTMSNAVSRLSIAALVALTASCGGSRYPDVPGGAPAPSRIERQPNVISSEELQDPSIYSRDAYTAIRHLRPGFFTYHGPNSFQQQNTGVIHISSDYGPLQNLAELAKMTTLGMLEVRYLNEEQAQARFGLNANGGPVIVLLYSKGAN